MNKAKLGSLGEDYAVSYLKNKNYEVIARNWRFKHLEIDIIALYKEELVFIEVKTRTGDSFCDPIDSITTKKKYNLARAAKAYIEFHQYNQDIRFDILLIVCQSDFKIKKIEHIEDAFWFQ